MTVTDDGVETIVNEIHLTLYSSFFHSQKSGVCMSASFPGEMGLEDQFLSEGLKINRHTWSFTGGSRVPVFFFFLPFWSFE